jgi:formimidoylglutamate deiminase
MIVFARRALLSTGWASDVLLTFRDGAILKIETGVKQHAASTTVKVLLPALANLHSHAFQRAMAGMSEFRTANQDSFWTWRTLMYRFLDRLNPDQMEAIAALVFMEMQEAGYASVGEFHYLHHQPGGKPYANPAELSERIFAAASQTDIGLTHLPVLYTYGGAGKKALAGGQLRFGNDVDQFNRLVCEIARLAKSLPSDALVGVAPHSLRATAPEDLKQLVADHPTGPIHIHVAEQTGEVSDIEAWLSMRPVEWLMANMEMDSRWCLIHATHMTEPESIALARSGAVVGLCPITEANLGDGAFNGPVYLKAKGEFGIGSDSNIRISLNEELRMLEYSQRQRDQARNVLAIDSGSTGKTLYLGAARGGAQALQRKAGKIAVGMLADLVAIDNDAPSLCGLGNDQLLDGLVFASGRDVVTDLWSAGRHVVRDGQHIRRRKIVSTYRKAVAQLIGDS